MLTKEFYERLAEDALSLLVSIRHEKSPSIIKDETQCVLKSYVWDEELSDKDEELGDHNVKLRPVAPSEFANWRPGRSLLLNNPLNEPGSQEVIHGMFAVVHAKTENALRNRIGELGKFLERYLDYSGIEVQPDGPIRDGFRWRGKEYLGLRNNPWRLLDYLWQNRERNLSFEELATPVWRDRVLTGEDVSSRFRSPQAVVNRFFKDNALPFEVSGDGRPHLKRRPE